MANTTEDKALETIVRHRWTHIRAMETDLDTAMLDHRPGLPYTAVADLLISLGWQKTGPVTKLRGKRKSNAKRTRWTERFCDLIISLYAEQDLDRTVVASRVGMTVSTLRAGMHRYRITKGSRRAQTATNGR